MDECLEILNKGELLGSKMARNWEDIEYRLFSLKWQQCKGRLVKFSVGMVRDKICWRLGEVSETTQYFLLLYIFFSFFLSEKLEI